MVESVLTGARIGFFELATKECRFEYKLVGMMRVMPRVMTATALCHLGEIKAVPAADTGPHIAINGGIDQISVILNEILIGIALGDDSMDKWSTFS